MHRWSWLLFLILLASLAACGDEPKESQDSAGTLGTPAKDAAQPPSPDPTAGNWPDPKVGECRNPTYEQVQAHQTTQAVPCSEPHTAYTFRVIKLHTRDAVEVEFQSCLNSYHKPLGIKPAEVAGVIFTVNAYYPNEEDWAAGERWLRCDLTAADSDRLHRLPRDIIDAVGDGAPPDRFARCIRGDSVDVFSCQNPHDFEFAGAFKTEWKQLPQSSQLLQAAESDCNRIVGRPDWLAVAPPEKMWDAGHTYLSCWRPV